MAGKAFGNWYLMKDKYWLPWYVGGTGQLSEAFPNCPFSPMDWNMYVCGLVLLGYPIREAVDTFVLSKRAPDFAELALHHVAHLSLASCYILSNVLPFGAMVAFVHDISDAIVSLAKFLHSMDFSMLVVGPVYLLMQVAWFYFRLMCLPFIMIDVYNIRYAEVRIHLQPYYQVSNVFLGVLFLLHVFWFGLFQKMNYMLLFKGEAHDLQE